MQIPKEVYRQIAAQYIAFEGNKLNMIDAITHFCIYGIYFGFLDESNPRRLENFDAKEMAWWILAAIFEYDKRHEFVSNQQIANIMGVHRNTVWAAARVMMLTGHLKKISTSSKGTKYSLIKTEGIPDFITKIVHEIFELSPDSPEVKAARWNPFTLKWTSDYVAVPLITKK